MSHGMIRANEWSEVGLGFGKSFKITLGVRFNVSGKGVGISAGVKRTSIFC